jgi:quinol monooxygenase YgiN
MRPAEPKAKYIVGWLTLRDGMENAFDALVAPYVTTCRAEPECRFFHMMRTPDSPLTVLVCECFDSEEAHQRHLAQPHFEPFWQALHDLALIGRFENVIAGAITPDGYDFTTGHPL